MHPQGIIYVLWLTCLAGLFSSTFWLNAQLAKLPAALDKCIGSSITDVIHEVDGVLNKDEVGKAFDTLVSWIETTAKKTVASNLDSQPIKAQLLKEVVDGIGHSDFVNMTLRNDMDKFTLRLYQHVHLFASLVEHEVHGIMKGVAMAVGYVQVVLLISWSLFILTSVLHVCFIACWTAYDDACHGSTYKVWLAQVIRYTVLLTTVVVGAIGAVALVFEKYGLSQIQHVQPLDICKIEPQLYTAGLAVSVVAAVQLLVCYLEVMVRRTDQRSRQYFESTLVTA